MAQIHFIFVSYIYIYIYIQPVERRRDKVNTWVGILASVRFLIYFVAFFLLCYPGEALEGQILTRVGII